MMPLPIQYFLVFVAGWLTAPLIVGVIRHLVQTCFRTRFAIVTTYHQVWIHETTRDFLKECPKCPFLAIRFFWYFLLRSSEDIEEVILEDTGEYYTMSWLGRAKYHGIIFKP